MKLLLGFLINYRSNKLEYISLYCNYKLNKQIDRQSLAFLEGLRSTIDLTWIRLFNHEELQYVISGLRRKGFDVADLKQNVEYGGIIFISKRIVFSI